MRGRGCEVLSFAVRVKHFVRMPLTRFLMRFFWLIPLRSRKIFFSSYEGKQYSCNPKFLYETMIEDPFFEDFRFVWELNDSSLRARLKGGARVHTVSHGSLSYYYHIMTSSCLITNSGISGRFPLRKRQININTWHGGGAFKRVGACVKTDLGENCEEKKVASAQTTLFLSSSAKFSSIMSESVVMELEKFFPVGMPRNDIFYSTDRCEDAKRKILRYFELDEHTPIVLYAPTYRGSVGHDDFNSIPFSADELKNAYFDRFGGDPVILVRTHYFNNTHIGDDGVMDASAYPEMQDLLCAADMLITDYSSSMWDYALLGRPCLIYAYDLHDYDAERGFYTDPIDWPGILCLDQGDLIAAVREFDPCEYGEKLRSYLSRMGCYDKGEACILTLDEIKRRLS